MAILELGIVKDGVPLVSKQYYQEYKVKVSQVLRAGFLHGINAFVSEVFSDEIQSFTLQNFKIVMLTHLMDESGDTKLITYCIGDKKLNLKFAKQALNKVSEEFFEKYGPLEAFDGNIGLFADFDQVLERILGDLGKKPDDRFRAVFQ